MAVICLDPLVQYFDNEGNPLAGGLLYTYDAVTDDARATYTDTEGTVPHENPIELDSSGRPPSPIFFTQGAAYNLILKTSAGVTVATNISHEVPDIAGLSEATNDYADVLWFRAGADTEANEILYAERLARAVSFLANWSGSYALDDTIMTPPTAPYAITVKQNGSTVGTVTLAATTGTATFATSGGAAVDFEAGDIISFHGQATPDDALANFGLTLAGTIGS